MFDAYKRVRAGVTFALFAIGGCRESRSALEPFPDRKSEHNIVQETGTNAQQMDVGIIKELASHGAHLNEPREILAYFYFPTRKSAQEVSDEIEKLGYEVEIKYSKDVEGKLEDPWLIVARKIAVVSNENIQAMRQDFTSISKKFDGDFDGWEAAVEP